MTRDEKIVFYDKIEKAMKEEHPVIEFGLTKDEILELIKTKSPLLNKILFNDLSTFKEVVWDLDLKDGTTLIIGSSAYTLDINSEDIVDDKKVINSPAGGRWIYNEGLIDYLTVEDTLVVGDDLTLDDALAAWDEA